MRKTSEKKKIEKKLSLFGIKYDLIVRIGIEFESYYNMNCKNIKNVQILRIRYDTFDIFF